MNSSPTIKNLRDQLKKQVHFNSKIFEPKTVNKEYIQLEDDESLDL